MPITTTLLEYRAGQFAAAKANIKLSAAAIKNPSCAVILIPSFYYVVGEAQAEKGESAEPTSPPDYRVPGIWGIVKPQLYILRVPTIFALPVPLRRMYPQRVWYFIHLPVRRAVEHVHLAAHPATAEYVLGGAEVGHARPAL